MVVYDGLSLRFFSGKGFKTICGAAAEKFGVRLDKDNIRDLVMTKAKLQRTELTKELEGKYVYLKFDGATRLRAHFLGVNVQYWSNDGGLKVKTLALVDTQAQHGSESLKTLVLQTMQRFNIPLSRVMACVTDNASNMTKTIKLLNDQLETAGGSDKNDVADDDEEEDDGELQEEEQEEEEEEDGEIEEVDEEEEEQEPGINSFIIII